MAEAPTTFWDDLAEDLKDPEALRTYVAESVRIGTIDRLVNQLDDVREANGLTKAELARSINAEPAVVRRLLSLGHRNPTIGTLVEVAAALGLRVTLEPMPAGELKQVTGTLRSGTTADRRQLLQSMQALQRNDSKASA